MSMTNEELARTIEAQRRHSRRMDAPYYFHDEGFDRGLERAAALVRANAPALRPAPEATVGEDVMIVTTDGDVVKAQLFSDNGYGRPKFEREHHDHIESFYLREVLGWFPVPEFANVKGRT